MSIIIIITIIIIIFIIVIIFIIIIITHVWTGIYHNQIYLTTRAEAKNSKYLVLTGNTS